MGRPAGRRPPGVADRHRGVAPARRGGRLTDAVDDLRRRLAHVRWLGGGSGAGKSTVATRLAEHHDLTIYKTEPFSKHMARSTPADAPLLHEFAAMDIDNRWVHRSPDVMLRTFHAFRGETFPLVLEDLLALPADRPVLAEGFSLLPGLVAPLVSTPLRAVWLLPTPGFRRHAFASRGSMSTIAGKTSDPERALANLLERDRLFTDQVRRDCAALELQTLDVDGRLTVDQLSDHVGQLLELD